MTDWDTQAANIDNIQPPQPIGIQCIKCGCCHFYTLETRKTPNVIRRRRECRHCGKRITTKETVA